MRAYTLNAHQYALYLGRIYVYAADFKHIVRAPHNLLHAKRRPAAWAIAFNKLRDIMRTIPQQR
ncbi:hypothetical protein SDC9_209334 [bioreactor metagenome]|uniref:Uncharacterized protein n=1 Tax=bioreactor metagenome TaxID=1076179 RepID=A0A645JDQ4_9ZZZZ